MIIGRFARSPCPFGRHVPSGWILVPSWLAWWNNVSVVAHHVWCLYLEGSDIKIFCDLCHTGGVPLTPCLGPVSGGPARCPGRRLVNRGGRCVECMRAVCAARWRGVRGRYGAEHRAARRALVMAWAGAPCPGCGEPLDPETSELDHSPSSDHDGAGDRVVCRRCNRGRTGRWGDHEIR